MHSIGEQPVNALQEQPVVLSFPLTKATIVTALRCLRRADTSEPVLRRGLGTKFELYRTAYCEQGSQFAL